MRTVITCTNGHYICTYTGLLEVGERVFAEQCHTFAEGIQPFEPMHAAPSKCPFCDGQVFSINAQNGWRVHTSEGWKP